MQTVTDEYCEGSFEASHLDAAALTEIKHGDKIVTND